MQAGPDGGHRVGPPNLPVLTTGGGCDLVRTGWEDAVYPSKYILDSISCLQQDRAVLPGAQGIAQK